MSEYKILKVIGKGAFGDAYLGMNVKQQKQYVIKQVDIKNKSKQQKQHIFNEVKLLQQFHHVNIVSYRDSFIDRKGLLNIVMEYCEGGDMNQIIESMQGNKLSQDKILYWVAQMALAIFYMHEKKILHRDLKSPNIFILKGNIRLGDFGISKVLDHVRDLAQTNIGTPYYMSPEQYNHKPYSYKSDIWAFGCILYEMCNQRRPFEANNIQALGMKVVRGNFPPVSQCYSKQLKGMIGEMLEKNPVRRPNVIEILMRPFVKKKAIEYMREILSKKQAISKQTLQSLLQQAKKLSISLEQKKVSTSISLKQPQPTTQRQRSTSSKKNLLIVQQQKQKQKKQRQHKKQQLQNELKKHNQQRKQMAQKLKKIQQQRKSLLQKRKSQKNLKSIYEKVQSTANNSVYVSEKYDSSRPSTSATAENRTKRTTTTTTQESSTNLIGKVLSEVAGYGGKGQSVSVVGGDKGQAVSGNSNAKVQHKKQQSQPQQQKHSQSTQQKQQPTSKPSQPPLLSQPPAQQKKTFKMQQQYEMQFQDCQPQQQQYKFDSDQQQQQQQQQQIKKQREFESQNRLPTFANDDDKLAQEVREIRDLVFVSNQAVEMISKKDFMPGGLVMIDSDVDEKKQQRLLAKQIEEKAVNNKDNKINNNIKSSQPQPKHKIHQSQQKVIQQTIQQKISPPISVSNPHQIQQKVQTLKQQIKNKTQHINSIRNQLSNIDFSLSESEDQHNGNSNKQQLNKGNFSKKKQQFNPQHAKINDRVNMLKQSAVTILGSEMYKKFYQYLVTIKQKGRTVKRDYLQNVLGQEKIGAYHLVEQIVRLSRMLQKIPKWL